MIQTQKILQYRGRPLYWGYYWVPTIMKNQMEIKMENEMETGGPNYQHYIMENQMEKRMEKEMETGII